MLNPRHYAQVQISAIIPAFNEAKNILQVLRPLKQVAAIREIILVDDGSTDGTAELAQGCGGIRVLRLPQNKGKTKAVILGLRAAGYSTILLCDADLIGLRASHFFDLIHRYCEGYEMVIMDKGSQPWVFRKALKSVPAVSGTRILEKERFLQIPFKPSDRFQMEIRINDYFLAHNLLMAISPAVEVYDPRKYVKYAFFQGVKLDIQGGLQVVASDGVGSIWKNLNNFWKIQRLLHASGTFKGENRITGWRRWWRLRG